MILNRLYGALAVALVIAALFLWGRGNSSRADAAEQRAEASEARVRALSEARDKEAAAAKRANAVAEQYEKDKQYAEAEASRLAADLRAGRKRLQDRWACPASTPAGASGQPDAAPDDRAESASRIIGAADAADAQIKGLQDFIRSERE